MHSLFEEMLQRQLAEYHAKTVLFTDIDQTFRMMDGSLQAETFQLFTHLEKVNLPVVAVTGATFSRESDATLPTPLKHTLHDRIRSGDLPAFQMILSDLGTRKWLLTHTKRGTLEYQEDVEYRQSLVSTGFNRSQVRDRLQQLSRNLEISQRYHLRFQESGDVNGEVEPEQNFPFKVSAYFESQSAQEAQELLEIINTAFPDTKNIICEEKHALLQNQNRAGKRTYCLDLLALDKGEAVDRVISEFKLTSVIRAGDSGNDVSLLIPTHTHGQTTHHYSIAVGGAEQRLLESIQHSFELEELYEGSEFQLVSPTSDVTSLFYLEPDDRQGPLSLKHALSPALEKNITRDTDRKLTNFLKKYPTLPLAYS